MEKMKSVLSAGLVAVGIVVLGICIKAGFNSMSQNARVVTVKGLAEREVKADKVIWPIVLKKRDSFEDVEGKRAARFRNQYEFGRH